jgi:hypothetical protein
MMTASWIKVLKYSAKKYIQKKYSPAGKGYVDSPDERKDKAMAEKEKRKNKNREIFEAIRTGKYKIKKVK